MLVSTHQCYSEMLLSIFFLMTTDLVMPTQVSVTMVYSKIYLWFNSNIQAPKMGVYTINP